MKPSAHYWNVPGNISRCLLLLFCLHSLVTNAQYFKIDSLESKLKNATDLESASIWIAISEQYYGINIDTSMVWAERAVNRAKDLGNDTLFYKALIQIHHANSAKSEYAKDLVVVIELLQTAERLKDHRKLAEAHQIIGSTYQMIGMSAKALSHMSQSLQLYTEIKDDEQQVCVLNNLSNLFADTGDNEQAVNYFNQVIERSSPESWIANLALLNIAGVFQQQGRMKESIAYLDKALQYFEKHEQKSSNYSSILATTLASKAKSYFLLKRFDQAQVLYKRSLSIFRRLDNKSNTVACLIYLAKIAMYRESFDDAKALLNEAAPLISHSNFKKLASINEAYAELYRLTGDYRSAFTHQQSAHVYRDSIEKISEHSKFQELKARFGLQQAEAATNSLKHQNQNQQIVIGLLTVLGLSIVVIVLLIVKRLRLQYFTSSQSHVNLYSKLRDKDDITSALKEEIQYKVKELSIVALGMLERKETLESIRDQIEQVVKNAAEIKSDLQKILNTIRFSSHLEKDWETFKLHFEHTNQRFFDNLTMRFPDINSNDLKLCALIRLSLDTKQIASILDISPESAKVAKHRIRKKFGLTASESLPTFLNKISSEPLDLRHKN
jgi:tetratricopeptide (TPR) repeat protein